MPLPPLENLSALDLLRLADNPTENVRQLMLARIIEGKPLEERILIDELVWLYKLAMSGGVLKNLLDNLTCDQAIALLAQGFDIKKNAGPRPNLIYQAAIDYELINRKKPIEVFHELVWPALVELKIVQPDKSGEIDPKLKEAAWSNYLNARRRRQRQKKSNSS